MNRFFNYVNIIKVNDQGNFKLVLESVEGDADLYVSSSTRFVDFSNYEWQSTTCGIDEILVSKDMRRPVYAAVYAHPHHFHTVYKLSQYAIAHNVLDDKRDEGPAENGGQ